jgi:hypothetical protein
MAETPGDRIMAQLVQSKCPGCKNVLRIPADWLHQPIRCKHCGLVMQAKQPAAPAPTPAAPPQAPPKRPAAPAPRPVQAVPAPAAGTPAAPAVPASGGSPFADLTADDGDAPRRRRRRHPHGGGWWKGPVLALAVLVTAGVVAALNWERILALMPAQTTIADKKDEDDDTSVEQPEKKSEGNGGSSTKVIAGKTGKEKKGRGSTTPTPRDSSGSPITPAGKFPRRALVISVHDYLYANPIHGGPHDPRGLNLTTFIDRLSQGFKIPYNQIAHLSDEAGGNSKPRAPTREVIEKTLTNFLDSSRPQDHILVFFVGHSAELGEEVYLAPIEGELDNAATLIPLKWVYEKLAGCKARQKVLVLDVNRYSATFGQERPGSGEMGPKLDALLKAPPAGVQVWSACGAKQKSYETDNCEMGVFFDSFYHTLIDVMQNGRLNRIQKAEEPLPLEPYVGWVNERMKKELEPRKLEEVSRLTGTETDPGVTIDKNEPAPPDAITCLAPAPKETAASKAMIAKVLEEIGTPPVKITHETPFQYDALPSFSAEVLKKYRDDKPNPDSPLRKAVTKARATLWAIYPGQEPKELQSAIGPIRAQYKVRLNDLPNYFAAPPGGNAENVFKAQVEMHGRKVALLLAAVEDALEELQKPEVVGAKDGESKRWKANYDFILARVQMEHAYLYEYDSMFGQIRKEFPPRDQTLYSGWKLASQPELTGDSKGKKSAKNAQKLLDKIIKDHAGTPWEVLAKREKLTSLGLEWQAANR